MLQSNQVIVCVGTGGVGKTTMSAALGIRAAQLGIDTLVLTVDPAKRLATALGLDLRDDAERPVQHSYPGKLHAAVIDSRKTFDSFIAKYAANREAAQRILRNPLYQQMSTTLSGSQEFTSLERLLTAVESGSYRLVILDTPPTQHAMDFLTAPERINALFQDSVTKWFFPNEESHSGFFASILNRGTKTVIKSLEVLTGGQFIEELVDFFASVRSIQKVLRDRSLAVHRLLTGSQTKFVLVTSFDAAKLSEANYLQRQLKRLGYALASVVINRAFPVWLPEKVENVANGEHEQSYRKVVQFYQEFREFYSHRYRLYESFAKNLADSVQVIRIPEYTRDIYGLAELEMLAAKMSEPSA